MNLTEVFNQENKVMELQMPFPIKEYNGEIISNDSTFENLVKNKVAEKTKFIDTVKNSVGINALSLTANCVWLAFK